MLLRDYQLEAVEFLLPRRRAFVQAPAGSGKTILGAAAVARVVRPGQRVLWLANTKEQVEQGIAAIQRMPGPQGVEFEVCCVAAQPDGQLFDVIVTDECHHLPAVTWSRILSAAKPDAIVWGLTATPWHEDEERNEKVREAFPEHFVITRDRVEASGHLAPGKVYMHDLDVPGQFDGEIERRVSVEVIRRCRRFPMIPRFEHTRRAQWQITQEIIQANENRNAAAVRLSLSELAAGQSVLLLVSSIDHGSILASRIPGSALCHSKVGAKNRRNIIEGFRSGAIPAMVATSLADEGFDSPRASRLVLVSGGRSSGKVEQRAGRILRPFPGKEVGIVHDFMDRGAVFAQAQARARWNVYQRLGYEPELVRYCT